MSLPFQTFTARLSTKKQLTPKFFELHFELVSPSRLSFQAGQYVIMSIPGFPQKKSYSICSAPQTEHAIDLLIDTAPGGPGSKYAEAIQPGDEATFMAPFGRFISPALGSPARETEKQLAFVATGSGIAPMMSFLEDLLIGKGDTRPMTLYWGLRFAEDQFWYDEFQSLSQQHPNFTFHPILSRPPEEWPLCRGRVTDCLSVHPQNLLETGYYVCGNSGMIDDTIALLKKLGVPDEHINHERFH